MSSSASSSSSDEMSLTLTTLSGLTDTIVISKTQTTCAELSELASALLGVDGTMLTLSVDGREIYSASTAGAGGAGSAGSNNGAKKVGEQGVNSGDVVLVGQRRDGGEEAQQQQQQATAGQAQQRGVAARPGPLAAPPAVPAGAGGLDFSSLLGGAAAAPPSAAAPAAAARAPAAAPASAPPSQGGGGGGLVFNISGLESAALQASLATSAHPVEWDGMSLDDAVRSNPNPSLLVPLLLSDAHPNLMKELNYHSPGLAKKIKDAYGAGGNNNTDEAVKVWREEMMRGGIEGAFRTTMTQRREREMNDRLRANPDDPEAKKYFEDKTRKRDVDAQYRQMMEEYPESMGRVLMLYIDAEVNGHPIQAFVDSGAQSTIMSSACAERCGLLHLLDRRFEGVAVGVGTGKILGRVHITPLKIGGHYFPCTITVMDSKEGLGDKNMDFLFGLDMLKRHRCCIDLMKNALVFSLPDGHGGQSMEAPFLHEKDLDEKKGGTKGFDADRANAELARRIEAQEREAGARGGGEDEESGYEGGESEAMDVEVSEREAGKDKVAKKRG